MPCPSTTTPISAPPTTSALEDPNWLRYAYLEQERTVRSIASELGTSHATVWRRLVQHSIPRRRKRVSQLACADRAWLKQHYVDEHRSLRECAAMAGSSHESVRHWLQVFNLPIRDLHEAVAQVKIEPYP